ncbi:hypothetical protein PPYC1_06575 [Paenibacillus polymyxa]|uniref:hypothetical protein n=1 Tax=Paenibacillus polymyxa TaxID=1406 RepID=UPI0008FC47C6|nr:hypothetical protein [Paenibacillus polymyxa]APB70042.1 hypothetical protein PPYC1_06575 [Paenibacillus polymyxa]
MIWVSKSSFRRFSELLVTKYVAASEAKNNFNGTVDDFRYRMREYKIPFIQLTQRYYLKTAIERVLLTDYLTTQEADDRTGIPMRVIKRYGADSLFNDVIELGGRKMIPASEADRVSKELQSLRDKHYTPAEAKEYLGVTVINYYRGAIDTIPCPPIAKAFAYKFKLLYSKDSVHAYDDDRKGAHIKKWVTQYLLMRANFSDNTLTTFPVRVNLHLQKNYSLNMLYVSYHLLMGATEPSLNTRKNY